MVKPKNILIGGITGGIGSSLANILQKEGHSLVGFARNEEKLSQINHQFPAIQTLQAEATDPESLKIAFEKALLLMGSIDAYVHAIGSIIIKPAHLTSTEHWMQTIQLNLSSAFFAMKEAIVAMQKQNHGALVFYSSTAAKIGIANHEAIAASKGGIEAMVRSAAATYSNRNLRFNCIAPGLTDTNLAKPITSNPTALAISKKMCPLNDIAKPEDIASLTQWLISDRARFITGQCFTVDGGLSSTTPKPKA